MIQMSHSTNPNAVVLLSGADSATVLPLPGNRLRLLRVEYGLWTAAPLELHAAGKEWAQSLGVQRHPDNAYSTGCIWRVCTDRSQHPGAEAGGAGIPVTYVPRAIPSSWQLALVGPRCSVRDIFVGVNAVDYSGYPDCRPEFISALRSLPISAPKPELKGGLPSRRL